MTIYTTLNKIRAVEPSEFLRDFKLSENGWEKLLKSLGKTSPDDEPLALVSILKSNGLDDAIWCTRTVFDEHRDKIVRFAIGCAENVLPIFEKAMPNDLRPRQAIQAAKDYLGNKITKTSLEYAAYDALIAAMYVEDNADVSDEADWVAAMSANEAAMAAKYAADAARDAAAAADAARDVARTAWAAERAAWRVAPRASEIKFQEDLFRKIF